MAMEGNTACAVGGCTLPLSGANNLCDEHRLPGGAVRVGTSTMVITCWYGRTRGGGELGTLAFRAELFMS